MKELGLVESEIAHSERELRLIEEQIEALELRRRNTVDRLRALRMVHAPVQTGDIVRDPSCPGPGSIPGELIVRDVRFYALGVVLWVSQRKVDGSWRQASRYLGTKWELVRKAEAPA